MQFSTFYSECTVACTYAKFCFLRVLKSSGESDLLQSVTLAVPIFHVYGHKVQCQVCKS